MPTTLALRPRRAKTARDAFRLLLERTQVQVAAGVRSPETLEMQQRHADYLLEHLDPSTPINEITPRRIARVLELEARGRRKPLSANSLRKRASTLSQALELARGRRPKLPDIPYRYEPKIEHLPDFASYERLRDALPEHRRLWFVLSVWTGQRRSDVEAMTRDDIDLEKRAVRIRSTKTKRPPKWFAAAPELLRELGPHVRELPAGARLVEPWRSSSNMLPKLCRRLGLPHITAHRLRHTFFTWFVGANGFTPELLELGGWKDLTIPARVYAHAAPARLQEQIERTHQMVVERRGAAPQKTRETETGTTTPAMVAKGGGDEAAPPAPSPVPAHGDHAIRGQGAIVVPPDGQDQRAELVGPAGIEPATYGLKVPFSRSAQVPGRPWVTTERDHARSIKP